MGVRAGARSARHRHAQGALRAVHRRPRGARPATAARSPTVNPATEETLALVARATPADVDQGGPRRAPGPDALVGHAARQGTRQVPVPDRPDPPGAEPRVRRPRDRWTRASRSRRAATSTCPLAAAHFWYYAGWADKLEYAFPGRVARPLGVAAPDHPVELPAADAGLEDRAGAGRRQHGRPQARVHDAAVGPPLRRRLPPGRPAAGRRQHRHRAGRDRDGAGHPSRRRQGRLHRLDRDRQARSPRASPAPTRR